MRLFLWSCLWLLCIFSRGFQEVHGTQETQSWLEDAFGNRGMERGLLQVLAGWDCLLLAPDISVPSSFLSSAPFSFFFFSDSFSFLSSAPLLFLFLYSSQFSQMCACICLHIHIYVTYIYILILHTPVATFPDGRDGGIEGQVHHELRPVPAEVWLWRPRSRLGIPDTTRRETWRQGKLLEITYT